ncbi:MAG: sigma-70 family RNA polymerase sigma factor [Planctomycetales bacterium]|nr:sigma-70 family RNA polymerase sigma factor [Planctomycetales bacterium]
MQTTSVSLLDRLASAGENSDWQRLLQIYRPFVFAVVKSYPDLESQADDISQETMMILLRELPTFKRQRKGSFRTWLRGIIVNQLRKAARKSRRYRQPASDGPRLEEQIEDLNNPESLYCQQWEAEHDKQVLDRAMEIVRAETKPDTWKAFQLYALEDKKPNVVANQLGLSTNMVLLAKSRVLKALREEVAGLVDDF